jgi:hypothetical protein
VILIARYNWAILSFDGNLHPTLRQSGRLKSPLFFVLLSCIIIGLFFSKASEANVNLRLLLTSNIQGNSTLKVENQASEDPLLILAQSILAEKEKGADLYLDLGNGFYPGVISKFSFGSIMMDFFDSFDCAATLVSSKDLQISVQNLNFLQKRRNVRLLSANIRRTKGSVFTPYLIKEIRGVPIAFVGLSSHKLEFDISEKNLYGTKLVDEKEALEALLTDLCDLKIEHIILLSGLNIYNTLQLLENYREIDLALCGGDYTGQLYDSKTSRIDLVDGRSMVMLDRNFDYYTIDLNLTDNVTLLGVSPKKALPKAIFAEEYSSFSSRLTIWKKKYLAEQHKWITQTDKKEYLLDDMRLLQLMRDRFNCEIAIVDKNTINAYPIKKNISLSDLLHLVNLDYNIFRFHLNGDQVSKTVAQKDNSNLEIAGYEEKEKINIQGYPIESKRRYSVAATQSALKKIGRFLNQDIKYNNSWKTVTDLMTDDLSTEKVLLHDDYTYLDNRFRTLIDVYLANFIASGSVQRDKNIETPVDQPEKSYNKWGLEDFIDLSFYNRNHRFVLTPYIFYSRQNDSYVQNLLRGTILYEYNLSEDLRPYNKFQCDSVVEEIEGQRPVLIRETIGVSLYGDYLTGKIGLGFEKKVQDPTDNALYGFETILSFNYPFLNDFTYIFEIDNFISTRGKDNIKWDIRSEVNNVISLEISTFLSVSLRHKYFYLFENDLNEVYRSSQILTSLDLKTDWKIW